MSENEAIEKFKQALIDENIEIELSEAIECFNSCLMYNEPEYAIRSAIGAIKMIMLCN